MEFPTIRMRRLRKNENLRRLVRETSLSVNDLIYPLFAVNGENIKKEIKSMPGNYQMSIDMIVKECKEVFELGIPGVLLFGIPDHKDETGSDSYSENGIIQRTVRAIKKEVPNLLVITDICFCEYTSHGHCGVIKDGTVDNDETLKLIQKQALSHAQAGADILAPSDMMDGRVGAIRSILDENGFNDLTIMAYSAKYSQMDSANSNEALREVELDIIEGADIVMVKPALSYLDVIYRVKSEFGVPVAAYNVSGEFSMIKAAERNGWLDGEKIMMEVLYSIKRAGADIIITYFAKDVARILNGKK